MLLYKYISWHELVTQIIMISVKYGLIVRSFRNRLNLCIYLYFSISLQLCYCVAQICLESVWYFGRFSVLIAFLLAWDWLIWRCASSVYIMVRIFNNINFRTRRRYWQTVDLYPVDARWIGWVNCCTRKRPRRLGCRPYLFYKFTTLHAATRSFV